MRLQPYDSQWPGRFREAADELRGTGLFAWIEHVGSTAVPGLAAKPIIDLMSGIRASVEAEALVTAMASLGYSHRRGAFIDRETFVAIRMQASAPIMSTLSPNAPRITTMSCSATHSGATPRSALSTTL